MEPEILHRCESCGAAIREPAMFCPECGKPLAPTNDVGKPQSSGSEHPRVTSAKPATQASSAQSSVTSPPDELTISEPRANGQQAEVSPQTERDGARARTRETLHRASTVARGAIEGNVKRVEKIHHVSTAMLEEAHTDPSLRFVLVALALFVIFIILLVLSKVMG